DKMKEPIEDKAPKPPGLLPKHVQSWLILGLAVLMIVIMWLTGGKKHESATKATVPVAAAPQSVELNESKIAELQSRIQELQREQLVAQSALAHESRLLGGMPSGEQQANVSPHPSAEHTEDRIKAERRTREYLSLFASNLALSYRKAANRTEPGEPEPAFPVTEEPRAAPALPPQDAALLSQMLNDAPLGVSPQSVPAAELTTSTCSCRQARKFSARHARWTLLARLVLPFSSTASSCRMGSR